MAYPLGAVERAMKVRDVILQRWPGKLTWLQAGEILGRSDRSMRRMRLKFERYGFDELYDRRRRTPIPEARAARRGAAAAGAVPATLRRLQCPALSPDRPPPAWRAILLRLREEGPAERRPVAKHRARGRHRRRREPRPCFGELLHLDGSRHQWLALVPDAVVHHARRRRRRHQTGALRAALARRRKRGGRAERAAGGAATLRRADGPVYRPRALGGAHAGRGRQPRATRFTQVGRALARLGIEHILGYSPQARGRSERANRTLQGRLVNELRVAGITTLAVANRYLRERFIPAFNVEFARAPADATSAFVPLGGVDLEQILCVEHERSSAATTSSPPIRSPFSSPSSPAGAPVRGSGSWSGATSMAIIRSGTAPAALVITARPAPLSGPGDLCRSLSGHFMVSNSCGRSSRISNRLALRPGAGEIVAAEPPRAC